MILRAKKVHHDRVLTDVVTKSGLTNPGSAAAIARLFRSQLYGVTSFDPITLTAAVVLTAAMVVLASALPARRAASVQPMRALRVE